MFTIKELLQKKSDAVENSDLPIEDFIGWDGWIRLIDSHIEQSKKAEKLHFEGLALEANLKGNDKIIEQQQKEIERLNKMLKELSDYYAPQDE